MLRYADPGSQDRPTVCNNSADHGNLCFLRRAETMRTLYHSDGRIDALTEDGRAIMIDADGTITEGDADVEMLSGADMEGIA
jgi:hypothetical protein